jgi:hypothetical protein
MEKVYWLKGETTATTCSWWTSFVLAVTQVHIPVPLTPHSEKH